MVVRRGYCGKVVIIRFDVGKRRRLFFLWPLGNKDSRRHSDYRKGEIPGEFVAAQNHRKHRAQRAFKRQNKRNFRRVDCLLRARLNDISKRRIQHAQGEKRKDNDFGKEQFSIALPSTINPTTKNKTAAVSICTKVSAPAGVDFVALSRTR